MIFWKIRRLAEVSLAATVKLYRKGDPYRLLNRGEVSGYDFDNVKPAGLGIVESRAQGL